jgi:hypothetical protein
MKALQIAGLVLSITISVILFLGVLLFIGGMEALGQWTGGSSEPGKAGQIILVTFLVTIVPPLIYILGFKLSGNRTLLKTLLQVLSLLITIGIIYFSVSMITSLREHTVDGETVKPGSAQITNQ